MHTTTRLPFLSPAAAAHLAKQFRQATRRGLLTHHQRAVLEALLWDLRKPGSVAVIATYSRLIETAAVCRQVVADAIRLAVQFGWFAKIKHKTLTTWANGGRRWRQKASEYVFRCESTAQTEYPKEVIKIHTVAAEPAEITAARDALERRQREIEQRLLTKGNEKRS